MTKPIKWHVRPVKTPISLGICPVWSVFAVHIKKAWVLRYTLTTQQRCLSDWMDTQADLSLCLAHMPFCRFCWALAQFSLLQQLIWAGSGWHIPYHFTLSIWTPYFLTIPILKHYENTSIQIYWKFYNQKRENFDIKNSDIFHIFSQNIDCGYSLEPPQWGGSNEYP